LGESSYSQNTVTEFEMQGSKGASIYSTSSDIGIAGETPNSTQILTETVDVQGTGFKMMEMLSGLGDEQWSKRILSEVQNLVDKLREDFANELEERDTAILLYKDLWRESEAALASIKCEMKHIKAELEALKQRQFGKDAHDLSVGECETSENRGRANCLCSLGLSLSPKEIIMDQAAIRLSHGKDAEDPDTKPNLNSLMNVTPQAHAKETFLERAAILFHRDKSLGEGDTSDNWGRTNCKNTLETFLNLKEDMMDESAMLLSQGRNCEELDSKTFLNSPVNVAPQVLSKETILERAAILFSRDKSLGEFETSENRGYKNSLEFNLNPNKNIMDKGAMLLSLGKDHEDLDTKTDLNSPVSVTPEAHAKGTFWEQAATISRDKILVDGEISESWGRANYKTSLEINLNPKQNIVGEGAMLLYQGKDHKDLDTKTNLSSPMHVTPQTHAEGTVLERAAILFSRDRSLGEGETSENKCRTNCKNPEGINLNPLEETRDISKSAYDTEEFSNSYLRPKIPSAFCMEQFLDLVPETDRSSEEEELIGTPGLKGQLESSSSVLSDDLVCSQSQCFYHGIHLEESNFDSDLMKLIDASTSENIMGKGVMLLSPGKDHEDLDTNTNLNSPVSVTPEAHAKETFWEQAAMVSQDKSLVDGEISENCGRANCKTSLEINLNLKENITGEGAMLLSQGNNHKDLDTKTNPTSPGNVTPQAHAVGPFLERAAILFSRDRSHGEGETCENRGRANCKDPQVVNLNPKENMADEGAMLLSQAKVHEDFYTESNLNSPVNVIPQVHTRETFLERAAILFTRDKSIREGEISRNWGRANCKTSFEINLNPKQNIMGEGAMLLSQGKDHKDLDTKTNLSSPVNVTPQTHAEGTVLERAAILFSRDRSLGEGETPENKGGANRKNPEGFNLNPLEETQDIIESAYDTKEFSNSYLRPKIPSTFCMEQFLDFVPETECSSEEDELIGTLGLKGQLESFSSVLSDDLVSNQSQCFYHGVQLEESNFDSDLTKLIDASTENSSKKRKCGNANITEDLSQILFANSFTIKKLDPEEGNVAIRINSQSCNDPPEGGADVKYLNEKELGFISCCQHDSDCIIVANEGESSSTKSDSSWEHIEVEEDISTAMNTSTFLV